jgi:hypothetical protein
VKLSPVMVTITESSRYGPQNRHTFVGTRPIDGHRQWKLNQPPHSHAENRVGQQAVPGPLGPVGRKRRRTAVSPDLLGLPPQPPTQRHPDAAERDGTIHLAGGVDVSQSSLNIILDAIASTATAIRAVDLDIADLNLIVSQLGTRLSALDSLTADQRRLAEPALYSEIVKRCSNL